MKKFYKNYKTTKLNSQNSQTNKNSRINDKSYFGLKKRFKRLLSKGDKFSSFKKSFFAASKHHQEYIKYDKKHHSGNKNFLFSKFMTYINSIPYSKPPFFFALYIATLVPQLLYVLKNIKMQGESIGWAKGFLIISLFCALFTILYWFFDLFLETNNIGKHNQKINTSISYGFVIFMLSEVCIFGGLFWGLFDRLFHASESLQSTVMPSGVHGLPTMELVLRGTLLLSLSCSAFNAMHRSLRTGDNYRARFWGHISIIIGVSFLIQQLEEYVNLPFLMSTNAHCSFFYAITGLHGIHVVLGVMFIGTIVEKTDQEKYNQSDLMSVTYAGIYWYFVDIVWIVLTVAVYSYGFIAPVAVLNESATVSDSIVSYIITFNTFLYEALPFEDEYVYRTLRKRVEEFLYFMSFMRSWYEYQWISFPWDFYWTYMSFALYHPIYWMKLNFQIAEQILYEFIDESEVSFLISYFDLIYSDPVWYIKFMWVSTKELLSHIFNVFFVFGDYLLEIRKYLRS